MLPLESRPTIDLPEDQPSSNTAHSAHTDQDRGAESALPLASDVVRLVRHRCRDIAVCTSGGEENAKVSNVGVAVEAHDWKPDEAQDHVENDDRATDVILVASPTGGEHNDGSQRVWRCYETLRSANRELHVLS